MRESTAALIPAFNAEPFLGEVVRRTRDVLSPVLVVDDGSTDQTARVAESAGAQVLRHTTNQGKGRALQTGFAALRDAGYLWFATLDADGQHLPEEIPALWPAAEAGADLVIGARDHLFDGMSRLRRFSNRTSSAAISAVAGLQLADVQSGFRLYSDQLLRATGFPEPRFAAESAVVVRAARQGFEIATVPIDLAVTDGRGTSHYRPWVDSARIAAAVTRARLERLS